MAKRIFLLLFLIIPFTHGYSQLESFPKDLSQPPDGVTIGFIDVRELNHNYENQILSDNVFVGEGLYFRMHHPLIAESQYLEIMVDLSQYRDQLDSLTQLITVELIDSINSCCEMYGCGDLEYGYYFTLKKGDKVFDAILDLNKLTPELCGNSNIITAVRILNDVLKKTNKN